MHHLVLLALTLGVSFANEVYRTARATDRIELTPVDGVAQTTGGLFQIRMLQLFENKPLRFMMVSPKGGSVELVELAHLHGMMPDDLAANFLTAMVDLEIRMANRHGLTLGRVAREVDLLIELARLNLQKTNAAAIQELIKANTPSLGATFLDMYAVEVRELELPARNLPDLKIVRSIYPNLNQHFARALATARRLLRSRPPTGAAQAWLNSPAPPMLDLLGEPAQALTRMKASVDDGGVHPDQHGETLRRLVIEQGCGELMSYAVPLPVKLPNTDDR